MTALRWFFAILYVLLFTYALVAVLEPGSNLELGIIAGTVLSLVLSYAPGVAGWYSKLPAENKQVVNIALMFMVAVVAFILTCTDQVLIGIVCTLQGALNLLIVFLSGLISGQGVHRANGYVAAKVRAVFSK